MSDTSSADAKPKKYGWYTRWVRRLAEVNQQEFAGQTPSCCEGAQPVEKAGAHPGAPGAGSKDQKVRRPRPGCH